MNATTPSAMSPRTPSVVRMPTTISLPPGAPRWPVPRADDTRRGAHGLGAGLEALGSGLQHEQATQLDDLVAQRGGLLELELLRGGLHLSLEILDEPHELILGHLARRD